MSVVQCLFILNLRTCVLSLFFSDIEMIFHCPTRHDFHHSCLFRFRWRYESFCYYCERTDWYKPKYTYASELQFNLKTVCLYSICLFVILLLEPRGYYGPVWFFVFRTFKNVRYRNFVPQENTVRKSTVWKFSVP